MIVIVLALLLVAVGAGVYRFSLTFEFRHRVIYWIVVVLAVAYFAPALIRGAFSGYRRGAEIRQQQGR